MNKFRITCCILFATISFTLSAQELDWLKKSTSNEFYNTYSFHSSTQYNDDFYFAGDYWQNLTIDGMSIDIGGDVGNGFILKMDETGIASGLWNFKSDNYVRINKIEVNPINGYLIATGNFRENLTFDGQEWEAPFYSNGFVMSIRPDGTLDWIKHLLPQNESSFTSGSGIAIDEMGNIFIGMEAIGDIEIENESFSFGVESFGVIIAKFNTSGDLISSDVWKNLIFEGGIDITDMAIDEDNQLITVGSILGNTEIADSVFTFSNTDYLPFIIKQDNNLNFKWLKSYQGFNCHVRDVFIDKKDLVLSIQYNTFIDIDGQIFNGSGSYGDMAIVSIDENAELKWAKNFTLSTNGGISGVYANSIIEWNDQYYIGGMYQGDVLHEGELIFDNGPGSSAYQYPFILSMNSDGLVTSTYGFDDSAGYGKIDNICSNESHLIFGGEFFQQIAIGDTSVSTTNSTLFYGALEIETTSISTLENSEQSLSVYPTITSDFLNIKTEERIDEFALINASGILLKEFSGNTKVIPLDDLVPGIYFLSALINGKMVHRKFIKQ